MKNKVIIITIACSACLFAACSGDRSPQSGNGDTVKNTYNAADSSKQDTGKMKAPDNSASGGASALKDTTRK